MAQWPLEWRSDCHTEVTLLEDPQSGLASACNSSDIPIRPRTTHTPKMLP